MHLRTALLLLTLPAGLGAQSFDVASIKPNAANDNRVMIGIQPGGRYTATGITVRELIRQAYNVRDFQISNAPGWTGAERYDINAKSESLPERVTPDLLRPLLQSLLQERFGLKVHNETKEMPVYALVPAKGGPKLTPSPELPQGQGQGPRGSMVRMGRGQLNGERMTMAMLIQQIAQTVGRPVIDKTDLKGEYNIKLEWTPEPGQGGGPFGGPPSPDAIPAADKGGPSIFTALQEQLGLRLESTRGPVQLIVIDNVTRPTEN